jgi:hypothetical protein
MGTLDKIVDVVGDIVIDYAAEHLLEWGRDLANKLLGNKADDGIRDSVARGAIEGAVYAAQLELAERRAADNLQAEAERVLGAIAAIDVDALFAPKPHGHAGPQEVEILEPDPNAPFLTFEQQFGKHKK